VLRRYSENNGSDADDRDAGAANIVDCPVAIVVDDRIASAFDAIEKANSSELQASLDLGALVIGEGGEKGQGNNRLAPVVNEARSSYVHP
jgi:hypothetical protein